MRNMLRNDQWERIEHLLPGKASDPGATAKDNRLFVEAIGRWIEDARVFPIGFVFRSRWATGTRRIRASRWGKSGVWQPDVF